MTQEQKELLVKDLCSRLPYGVKISIPDLWTQKIEIEILNEIFKGDDGLYRVNSTGQCIEHIKPYLFPLASMTEEQINNCPIKETNFNIIKSNIGYGIIEIPWKLSYLFIDWCTKNHIDYRGLIPMGIALDATGQNIY